ncbi:uncharacterized protein LOC106152022 [Lingula anatina]|uniref:Uncharacterized protein LOC106152022 n=1 Tax=Lingula anatina TaxID=7574 RepID=A0A1S3H638_LINAN|nr:uncharacterized protein LOC106152022 [Lingula anatina]|eukprot:XP_013380941.1 uncharacterized protein LOC106152022 [Lingula anatina]
MQDCARQRFESTEAKSVQFCTESRMCTVFSTELTSSDIEDAQVDSSCIIMRFFCDMPADRSNTDGAASNLGDSEADPGTNCTDILQSRPEAESGVYWISTGGQAFQVFCDMDSDGGGWTLVWSYNFTNFGPELTGALTPRPNWTVSEGDVPISITPPLNETDFNAVDFWLWSSIGNQQFMVKSTINNWVVCNGSSLVDFTASPLNCGIVKIVGNSSCSDIVPIQFYDLGAVNSSHPFGSKGPVLTTGIGLSIVETSAYYYFRASTVEGVCPAHDPCGTGRCDGHKPDPDMPYGNIYIR